MIDLSIGNSNASTVKINDHKLNFLEQNSTLTVRKLVLNFYNGNSSNAQSQTTQTQTAGQTTTNSQTNNGYTNQRYQQNNGQTTNNYQATR